MDNSNEHATLRGVRPSWDEYFMRIAKRSRLARLVRG